MYKLIATFGLCAVLTVSGCTIAAQRPAPVTEAEATAAFDLLFEIASRRHHEAMKEVCRFALDECHMVGMSDVVITDPLGPQSAPHPHDRPTTLCSRPLADDGWMLVVEGTDGFERDYVSQIVFVRDKNGRVVPSSEPAFWLGIGYSGEPGTGTGTWSTAHHPSASTYPEHTEKVLANARRACEH